ncbi:MAG: GNAT family N-acetyltransferase [Gammaproteobacteria bacterium]
MIRRANLGDLDALVQLETFTFDSDRLSRRSFRHLLTRGNAIVLVDAESGELRGYALLNFRAGCADARLYSIAVHAQRRRRGAGQALLAAAEAAARAHGARRLVLEVREDNHAAARLYARSGFHAFGRYLAFYADRCDALRLEKTLPPAVRAASPDFANHPHGTL